MKYIRFLVIASFIGTSFWIFSWWNDRYEYPLHREKVFLLVDHPEFIPSAQTVRAFSAGHIALAADTFWLKSIIYIGSNIYGEYRQYLYALLDVITSLQPKFAPPYTTGLLFLGVRIPEGDLSSLGQSIDIGLKGIRETCNADKIEALKKIPTENIEQIWNNTYLKAPCTDGMLPGYLAFIYYARSKDPQKAIEYYKVAAADDDTPKVYRRLIPLMEGKSGNRLVGAQLFLSLAQDSATGDLLETASGLSVLLDSSEINAKLILSLEPLRAALVNLDTDERDDAPRTDILRALREVHLAYLEAADKEFLAKNGRHASDPEELLKTGLIETIPVYPGLEGFKYYYDTSKGDWRYGSFR